MRSICWTVLLTLGTTGVAVAQTAPATQADAAKTLDLAKFPVIDSAMVTQRHLAGLSYTATGDVKSGFEFQRKQLASQKWTELPNGYVSDQYASGTFAKNGFRISVSVLPAGMPNQVSVTLLNHGNVDFDKLPLPPDAKPLFSGPVSKMLTTEAAADKTAEACRKLLLAQKWQPYGSAGTVQWYKQNAVKLGVNVSVAPAQGNKTVIDLQSALMSVDLPAPDETEGLQYTDSPTQLAFDSAQTADAIGEFYRTTLSKAGWKATTERPITISFREVLIFRNPAKDLLELETHSVDGKTRVLLKHQTAVQVAELEARLDAEQKRRAAAKNQPLGKLSLALPAGAQGVKFSAKEVEFQMGSGKARAAIEAWRKQWKQDGWKEETPVVEAMAGSITLTRNEQRLSVTYVDPGFIPAEITLTASGVELERADETK